VGDLVGASILLGHAEGGTPLSEVALVVLGSLATVVAVRRLGGSVRLAVAGVCVGAFALLGPPDRLADDALSAHMLQHVLLGDLAPLLLVLSLRGADLAWLVRRAGPLLHPLLALAAWAAVTAAWHVPAMYDLALAHERVHALEHGCFAAAGALVWLALLDPARRGLLAGWWRFAYAIALLAGAQMLGNVLILEGPLYGAYAHAERPFGLSAVGDQDAAAVVMMVEQVLTVGTFAFLTARRLVARTPEPVATGTRHPLAV
jgi:cytochrome c oxidase assembly factor CtaG